MKGFLRSLWAGLINERTQRWGLPPYAAWSFLCVFVNTAPGWRVFCLTLGVLYTFAAGWLWADWARKRDMRRRNAFVIEGATRAEVEAFIEELTLFVAERKAGGR